MDFEETPEEVAFRGKARAFLEAHAPAFVEDGASHGGVGLDLVPRIGQAHEHVQRQRVATVRPVHGEDDDRSLPLDQQARTSVRLVVPIARVAHPGILSPGVG